MLPARVLRGLLLAATLLAPGAASAQLEHEVKAAFLFRFLSFVEWPPASLPRAGEPLIIGVVRGDEVYESLREIARGREAQGRPVAVRRVREGERPAGLHLLFVARGGAGSLASFAPAEGTLVVCDWPGALDQGAMVNFLLSDGRVRFEVAPDAAERAGLRISSRMLSVAQRVRPQP